VRQHHVATLNDDVPGGGQLLHIFLKLTLGDAQALRKRRP
jgi:hypothetical protein